MVNKDIYLANLAPMQLDYLKEKLDERLNNGNLRKLLPASNLIDFVSNDYLGLAGNRELFEVIHERSAREGHFNGGTGSRLLSGNFSLYEEAEAFLAGIFRSEAALIFNSGYAANQALVSSVADKGDTIIYDQLAHVCLKEGAWLSKATTTSFEHNSLASLEAKLSRAEGRKFVLTESIFSMDGDVAPLKEIVALCEQYEAYLIVDEAHSTGVRGKEGSGMLVDMDLHDRVFARVYTFGKAMGVHGACVAGSKVLKEYLINFGRPFIYTTSLPPHSVISIMEGFSFLVKNIKLQADLQRRIDFFRSGWQQSISHTAIQPVLVGSGEKARSLSEKLQKNGYDVRSILSPTVQRGTERLRISLHVHNTEEEIQGLLKVLNQR